MLKIINLFVIDKIFDVESLNKLSAMAQICYLNCLMHHFKDKAPTVGNAVAFELSITDFENYDKFKNYMSELHKSELITINGDIITFNNVWGKYIDKEQLGKTNAVDYVGLFNFHDVTKFSNDLLNNRNIYELSQMKYKVTESQTKQLIDLFIKEQQTCEKKYTNVSECIKHCIYWIGANKDKAPVTSIKSKGKILGT